MLVGYARVSTDGQNLDRQIDALKAVGVDSRVLYQEKITGTNQKERKYAKKNYFHSINIWSKMSLINKLGMADLFKYEPFAI